MVWGHWRRSFQKFQFWALNNGYQDNLTIERTDNDGPYAPWNCCWVTFKAQQNHKRDNRLITFDGETHSVAEWVEITGIKRATIEKRLCLGWAPEKAVSTPVRNYQSRGG